MIRSLLALFLLVASPAVASEPEVRPLHNQQTTNRLINESSPYLLQHARNPVDWYPWGEEAFAAARERDVPIFLSIGYSTCYWCHVMERESFEDAATAKIMNERFVCIKVDREERPDVDDIYMAATQLMTGSGGWPMNSFLDPDTLRPFWCGTYFPPEPMHGRPSFTQVLMGMSDVWTSKRGEAAEQAANLAEAVRDHLAGDAAPAALGLDQIASAVTTLLQIYDRTEAGFGGAPKFPQPVYGLFLLDARAIVDDETRKTIDHCLKHTLDRMAVGGLFDQVGGGFHRYCVDGTWTVPHFEKMLYDNAQLLSLYSRAAALYDDAFYREIVRRTADYLDREMTTEAGGLCSAQDAEVDTREGLNYLWNQEQIRGVLGGDDAEFALDLYGLDNGTNFTDPHHPGDGPKNVLRLESRPDILAGRAGRSLDEFDAQRDSVNTALLAARDAREQPGLDDKVLASWNGMAIVGLVDASKALDDSARLDAAERVARFVLDHMRSDLGQLHRSCRTLSSEREGDGSRSLGPLAGLEDHAWMIRACVALHNAGRGKGVFLAAAGSLAEVIDAAFRTDGGAYADTAEGRADLFVRPRSTYDGAMPSGASTLALAFLELSSAGAADRDRALAQLRGMSHEIAERPVSAVNAVRAIIRVIHAEGDASSLAFGEVRGPASSRPSATSSASVVEVFADTDAVTVAGDRPATLALGIRIKPGYHILAADPVPEGSGAGEGLLPLRVGLISGQGVAVYADYPEGEPFGGAIVGLDELRVHTGELRLNVAIEHKPGVGASEGTPVLGITIQACDDTACLKPSTIRIGVSVTIGE